MAQDGVFFPALARIHPRYSTPASCILAQGLWATALTFSGSYEQLYTYVVFAMVLFHAATGAAVIVLRRTRPDAPRPYRTWGYPWVPLVFILSSLALVANTLVEKPRESGIGLCSWLWACRPTPIGAAARRGAGASSVLLGLLKRAWSAIGRCSPATSRSSPTPSPSTSCCVSSRCCWCSPRFSQRYQGTHAGAALLLLLQELIPFGQEAIAASLKSLTKIARGLEVFSLLLIVWGSSGIFMPVEMALNRAWGGRPSATSC